MTQSPNRQSVHLEGCVVGEERLKPEDEPLSLLFERYIGTRQQLPVRVSKFLVLIIALQLNSTIHYGIVYRLNSQRETRETAGLLAVMSNAVLGLSHTFLGITPHGLYLHDHFAGYEHLLALTGSVGCRSSTKKAGWSLRTGGGFSRCGRTWPSPPGSSENACTG